MIFNRKIKSLDKIEKPIIKFSKRYCNNIDARTAIKSLPLIGSYLDNLLAYKGSKIIQERMNLFYDELKKSLESLKEEKIDKEFLESDEGFYIFQEILDKVLRSKEKEKIKLLRNIFINSIKLENSKYYYKERLISIVADLSILHLKILEYYLEREKVFSAEGRRGEAAFTSLSSVCQKFNISESQAEAFCNDLVRYNLLYDARIGTYDYERNQFRTTKNTMELLNFITLET